MRYALILSLLMAPVLASPAFADCPATPDNSVRINTLVEQMRAAPDEATARTLSGQLWEIWLDAPDALAQSMLDEGLALNRMGDRRASRVALTELVDYCPNYPEGYNQRAFAAFLDGDFAAALIDLDAALALQPVHLGALTGKALTLIRLGRSDEAQEVLRTALDINPWLAERALLEGALERDL